MGSTASDLGSAMLQKQWDQHMIATFEDTTIALGDYGYVESGGSFVRLGGLQWASPIGQLSETGDLSFQDDHSSMNSGDVTVSGTFIDPEGGEAKVGTEATWQFTKDSTVQLQLPIGYQQSFDDLMGPLGESELVEQLWSRANEVGWITRSGQIKTGFGVVVKTLQIYAGAVVASEASSSTLTIDGSIDGIADLMSGKASGCWNDTKVADSISRVIWPGSGTAVAGQPNVNPLFTIGIVLATFDSHNRPTLYSGS